MDGIQFSIDMLKIMGLELELEQRMDDGAGTLPCGTGRNGSGTLETWAHPCAGL